MLSQGAIGVASPAERFTDVMPPRLHSPSVRILPWHLIPVMFLPICLLAALASIGSGLSMSKEYRGVFEDLIEKVGFAGCEFVRVLTSTRDV